MDVVALGVAVALLPSGLLTTEDALAGFSNHAVLSIAALFVVGGAIMQTGLAGAIGERTLIIAGKGPARLTAVIMLTIAARSAFMSDTGIVAVLLPANTSLAGCVSFDEAYEAVNWKSIVLVAGMLPMRTGPFY